MTFEERVALHRVVFDQHGHIPHENIDTNVMNQ